MDFDIIVVGGSFAGMSAALPIARARRPVLVIDAGQRRNRFASAAHGVLAQDGRAPDAIIAEARAQLAAYPALTWRDGLATAARHFEGGFAVDVDGQTFTARRLVLASGIVDVLPEIPGIAERWGRSVAHCPYCHGYEFDRGPLGVLASGAVSMHQALLVPDWGQTTFFTNASFVPDAAEREKLASRGVAIEETPVARVEGEGADIVLVDGRRIPLAGLFVAPGTRPASPLAEQLGCAFEAGPLGPWLRVNDFRETTVPGVFACGDAMRQGGSVSLAIGDGALAGAAAQQSLIFR